MHHFGVREEYVTISCLANVEEECPLFRQAVPAVWLDSSAQSGIYETYHLCHAEAPGCYFVILVLSDVPCLANLFEQGLAARYFWQCPADQYDCRLSGYLFYKFTTYDEGLTQASAAVRIFIKKSVFNMLMIVLFRCSLSVTGVPLSLSVMMCLIKFTNCVCSPGRGASQNISSDPTNHDLVKSTARCVIVYHAGVSIYITAVFAKSKPIVDLSPAWPA